MNICVTVIRRVFYAFKTKFKEVFINTYIEILFILIHKGRTKQGAAINAIPAM